MTDMSQSGNAEQGSAQGANVPNLNYLGQLVAAWDGGWEKGGGGWGSICLSGGKNPPCEKSKFRIRNDPKIKKPPDYLFVKYVTNMLQIYKTTNHSFRWDNNESSVDLPV